VTRQSEKSGVTSDIRAIFNTANQDGAKRQLNLFVERYQKSVPKLSQWAEDNIPEGLTVYGMDLCEFNRKRLRISNMIERLNQTVKWRTKAAKIFANKESCLRLVSAIVMEVSEQWVSGRMYLRVKWNK
jgi:transposase-like protein